VQNGNLGNLTQASVSYRVKRGDCFWGVMNPNWFEKTAVVALLLLVSAGSVSGIAAAAESDCGVDGCLDDPNDGGPEVVPGGGVAFDTPVVDTTGVMPGDRVTLGEDFEAFLKAKKAF
jgi:hypothetical protein